MVQLAFGTDLVVLPTDGAGKKVGFLLASVSGGSLYLPASLLVDSAGNTIDAATASLASGGSERGLVVRPAGVTQTAPPVDVTASGAVSAASGVSISAGAMSSSAPAANSSVSLTIPAGQNAVIVTVSGTYSLSWSVDGTNDGTNWFLLAGSIPGVGVATLNSTAQDVRVNAAGCSAVRVRCVGYVSGTANFVLRAALGATGAITDPMPTISVVGLPTSLGQKTMATTLSVSIASDQSAIPVSGPITVTGSATASGDVANDAADSGNPVKVGGVARSADVTNMTAGDRAQFMTDLQGRQIVMPYALPENLINGSTAAIVNTNGVDIIAAQAAGVRIYCTSLSIINSSATVDTVVEIRDGTSTVVWRIFAKAGGFGEAVSFPTPLRGTAATALRAYCITTAANVYVSAAGFISNE